MDLERARKVRDWFDLLAELEPDERASRLAALSVEDAELADEVRSILGDDAATFDPSAPDTIAQLMDRVVGRAAAHVLDDHRILHAGDEVGPYRVLRRIGRGGIAEVWAVRHLELGSLHALKVLRQVTPSLQERLRREGSIQARLHHPNLLPIRAEPALSSLPALLMPLVVGPTLGAVLRDQRLSRTDALALFYGIVQGVAYAHARGLVHRDLKPDNVLLDPSSGVLVPRVADFGIVKEVDGVDGQTVEGSTMGTPRYAAPEQLTDARAVGPTADVYSLGVLFVELLTGALPDPKAPDLHGLGAPFDAFARDLLAARPIDRPADAEVVLERMLAVAPTPSSVSERLRRAARSLVEWRHWVVDPQAEERNAEVVIHQLPSARDGFVGRVGELAALADQIGHSRLVTVTGAGGSGKTRLVQQVARSLASPWVGGWWVDLSEASDADEVLGALLAAVGVEASQEPLARLGDALMAHGRCLVCLDNLEQVAEPARDLLVRLLAATSEAVFLATSRVPLRVEGEHVVPLEPLTAEDARELFVSRARAAGGTADLQDASPEELDRLTATLDRLPLTLELAAAKMRLMDVSGLLRQLGRRFRLLSTPSRDVPARQRTLRATLDWSWELMSEEEQHVLAGCSVFEGGFTLEAAQAVLEPEVPDLYVDQILASLLEQGWVRLQPGSDAARFHLLVSMHAYAKEKLGVEGAPLYGRHATYFARLGEAVAKPALLRRAIVEFDNLNAVLDRERDHQDVVSTMQAAMAVAAVLHSRGPYDQQLAVTEAAIRAEGPPRVRAWVRLAHARALGSLERRDEALATLDEALGWLAQDPDLRLESLLVTEKAVQLGPASTQSQEVYAMLMRAHSLYPTAHTAWRLGMSLSHSGDFAGSRERQEEAIRLADEVGADDIAGLAMSGLASIARAAGRLDTVYARSRDALERLRNTPQRAAYGEAVLQFALANLGESNLDEAEARVEEAAQLFAKLGDRRRYFTARSVKGNVLNRRGRLAAASEVFEGVLQHTQRTGWRLQAMRVLMSLSYIRIEQERFEEADQFLAQLEQENTRKPMPETTGVLAVSRGRRWVVAGDGARALTFVDSESGPWRQSVALDVFRRQVLGQALILTGDLDRAEAVLTGVIELAEAQGDNIRPLICRMSRGELYLWRGEADSARRDLQHVVALSEKAGTDALSMQARLWLALVPGEDMAAQLAAAEGLAADVNPRRRRLLEVVRARVAS